MEIFKGIPGDIDLTQDLDFRRTKYENTPQLPTLWDKNTKDKMVLRRDDYSNYTSYINNINISTSSTTYTINSRWISSYDNDTHANYSLLYDGITDITYSFSPSEITLSNGRINVTSYYPQKSKYDVFGCKKINEPILPSIPWNNNKNYCSGKRIAWDTSLYELENCEVYLRPLPNNWGEKSYTSKIDLSDKYNRAQQLIAWLSDKSKSFIERYFDSSNDLKYLTNMNWIRVRDAVIDIV